MIACETQFPGSGSPQRAAWADLTDEQLIAKVLLKDDPKRLIHSQSCWNGHTNPTEKVIDLSIGEPAGVDWCRVRYGDIGLPARKDTPVVLANGGITCQLNNINFARL